MKTYIKKQGRLVAYLHVPASIETVYIVWISKGPSELDWEKQEFDTYDEARRYLEAWLILGETQ